MLPQASVKADEEQQGDQARSVTVKHSEDAAQKKSSGHGQSTSMDVDDIELKPEPSDFEIHPPIVVRATSTLQFPIPYAGVLQLIDGAELMTLVL